MILPILLAWNGGNKKEKEKETEERKRREVEWPEQSPFKILTRV